MDLQCMQSFIHNHDYLSTICIFFCFATDADTQQNGVDYFKNLIFSARPNVNAFFPSYFDSDGVAMKINSANSLTHFARLSFLVHFEEVTKSFSRASRLISF